MIAIINTGERNAAGAYRYRLQINNQLIAEFHHFRPDGLAACLVAAAHAAREADGALAEWQPIKQGAHDDGF